MFNIEGVRGISGLTSGIGIRLAKVILSWHGEVGRAIFGFENGFAELFSFG